MLEYQSLMVNVLRDEYGIEVKDISLLEGFIDRTFRINADQYIAKLVCDPALQDRRALDAETSLIHFLKDNSFPVAGFIPTKDGALHTSVEITEPGKQESTRRPVQVVSFLHGTLWCEKGVIEPEICENVGRFVGQLDTALERFKNEYYIANGSCDYLVNFGDEFDSYKLKELVKDDSRKYQICEKTLHMVDSVVKPVIDQLPMQQVHYDCNWRNLMVDDDCKKIVGLVDFGTSRYTCRIFEILIVIPVLYTHDHSPELSCIRSFMKGYRSQVELTAVENEVVFTCVLGRLLLVFLAVEKMKTLNPNYDLSTYVSSVLGNGWDILDDLLNSAEKKATLQAALLG